MRKLLQRATTAWALFENSQIGLYYLSAYQIYSTMEAAIASEKRRRKEYPDREYKIKKVKIILWL